MRKRTRQPRGRATWNIGVDLGGTRVRVLAVDGLGRRRAAARQTPGPAGLPALLGKLCRRWGLKRSSVGALVLASRGVWTAEERKTQARRLRGLARRVRVIPDAEAAYLGALGEHPGVLVLAGTGSMALGRDGRGRWARAGGLGPLLGDEGSAFWIGREWLREARDWRAARRFWRAPDATVRIARLAPRVLARARGGSSRAGAIVARAQNTLAELLISAASELRLPPPIMVSWAGGLLDDARFRSGVWRAARRQGLRLRPEPPREGPVEAAARLASRLS